MGMLMRQSTGKQALDPARLRLVFRILAGEDEQRQSLERLAAPAFRAAPQQIAEQRLGFGVSFFSGIGQPVDGETPVTRDPLALQIHPRQIELRIRVAQITRRMAIQADGAVFVRLDRAALNTAAVIVAKRHEGTRDAARARSARMYVRVSVDDVVK